MKLSYKDIIKNFFIYSGGAIFLKAVSAIAIPLNLKVINPAQYGILGLANGFSTILAIFLGLGLRQALWLDFFHHDNLQRKKILIDIITVYLIVSTPIFIILLLSISPINKLYFLNQAPYGLIIISLLSCFFSFFNELFFQILRYQSKAFYCTVLQIVSTFISISSNIILVFYFNLNILGVALANLIALIIPVLSGAYKYRKFLYLSFFNNFIFYKIRQKKFSLENKIDLNNIELIKKYIKAGAPFIPSMLFAWVLSSCDKLILARFCNMHEVGIYSLTDNLAQIFYVIILQPLSGSYLPALFESFCANKDNLKFIEYKNRKIMFLSIVLLFVLITLGHTLAKSILIFILPVRYYEVTSYLWLMLAGYIFLMGTYFSTSLIQFKKKTLFLSLSFCVPAIINIILNLLLIPDYGAYGCVLATTLSYLIYFFITIIYNQILLNNL